MKTIGVRAILISSIGWGQRLTGADDLWYPTMRKPPLASAPTRLEINIALTPIVFFDGVGVTKMTYIEMKLSKWRLL